MPLFFTTAEDRENTTNTLWFDDRAAVEKSWIDYRAAGTTFFKVLSTLPLIIDVWFKSQNQKLIDQFSHITIDCQNTLDDIVNTGNVQTATNAFNLKDCKALDNYVANNPTKLILPDFDFGENNIFAFFEPQKKEAPQKSFIKTLIDSPAEESPEPPKIRLIKAIALIDVKTPSIKNYTGLYTRQIEPNTDIVVYSDDAVFTRGNYAPFVVDERLILPPNAYVFRESKFYDFLTKKGFLWHLHF